MMRKLLSLALLVAAVAFAQESPDTAITENTWRGTLVDQACKQANVDEPCPVGPNTREFALSIDGGILLRFDENGNKLALDALRKSRSGGNANATAVGEREGRLLKVQSVEVGGPPVS